MPLPNPPDLGSSPLPVGCYTETVCMVTGGGTGLGKAIAVEFARLGASLVIVSRDETHRASGIEACEGAGARAIGVACDVRDANQVASAFEVAETELGAVGVLVNNAAGNFPVPAEDLSPNGWRAVTQIVLDGTYFCSRELARRAIAADRPAAIVNIGASYAWTGGPGFAPSAAAKAGVKNLTETLAVEWGPYGIRVNGLVPGLFPHEDEASHIVDVVPGRGHDEDLRCPAGRVGQPREIGWAATYLCSPWAAYISGHTMVIDGANWQRRAMLQPVFTPIRDQLGREPFQI
jgi:NAD(P)-dependent dehydrogenase (short-subunit alcohol dehydrogenase family)